MMKDLDSLQCSHSGVFKEDDVIIETVHREHFSLTSVVHLN